MLGNSNSGLTDSLSKHDFNRIIDVLEKCDDEWFGSDESLDISLGEMGYVAKNNSPDDEFVDYNDLDYSESWTVILKVGKRYNDGPGYRIEVISLDEMKEHFYSDDFDPSLYGIKDLDVFWNHEATRIQLLYYIQSNSNDLRMKDHYFDSPFSGAKLDEMLRDVYDMN